MKGKSCFLIILIIILILSAINMSRLSKANKMPLGPIVASYIAKPFVYTSQNIHNVFSYLAEYFNLKKNIIHENEELKNEIIRLKTENEALKDIAYREEEVEKLLEFKSKIKFNHKSARILFFSPTHWYKKATIDLGAKDHIKPGCGVIGEEGLIGQVSQVAENSSIIEAVTAEETAIGGRVERSGVKGLIIGDGSDTLIFTYLKLGVDLKIGDIILTYGDGSLIQSGIPVGTITDIKEDSLTNSTVASIKPFSDFNKSNIVFVVIAKE